MTSPSVIRAIILILLSTSNHGPVTLQISYMIKNLECYDNQGHICDNLTAILHQMKWGLRGLARTPNFGLQRIYTLTSYHFKCPNICKWSSILAAIENHHHLREVSCSYIHLFMINVEHVHKQFMLLQL